MRIDIVVGYTYNAAEFCPDCFNGDPEDEEVGVIFASSEMDRYPVCDHCGEKIEDVALTTDGLAYERRQEHAPLEECEDDHVLTPEQRAYLEAQPARLDRRGLKFGVIYEFDLAHTEAGWIDCYRPWSRISEGYRPVFTRDGPDRGIWTKTEGDDCYEYDHLEGGWIGGIHRKYVACLDKQQFKEFMERSYLKFETDQTGGALGGPTPDAPSGSISWQPAIAFRSDDSEAIAGAYITPYWVGKTDPDERDWDRIVGALKEKYG